MAAATRKVVAATRKVAVVATRKVAVAAHLCLTLIIKELKISVEHSRVVKH